jgi:Fic family protein
MRREGLSGAVRARLKRLPEPQANHYGVVPAAPPEEPPLLTASLPKLRAATTALARANVMAAELKDPFLLSRVLPRREAVSSSAIEGTNSTLDELLNVEEEGEGAEASTEAARQVRDYATTLEDFLPQAREKGDALFTTALVQDLHRAVMKSDTSYKDDPGALRTTVVWIGGVDISTSTYNPAPPEDVAATLEDSMRYLRYEGLQHANQHLITRMAIGHAHFEAVHPFRDGNGRVGRLLLPLMMAAEKEVPLYLSPYIAAHKPAYVDALKAAQQRLDWDTMVGFMAEAVSGTVDELMTTREALLALRASWQARGRFRAKSATLKALDLLPHYPVITINRLANLIGVSFPAASTAIDTLHTRGILKERTGYARNRIFAAPEALAIINRPFGEPPPEIAEAT